MYSRLCSKVDLHEDPFNTGPFRALPQMSLKPSGPKPYAFLPDVAGSIPVSRSLGQLIARRYPPRNHRHRECDLQFRGLAVRPVEVPDVELPLDEEPSTVEELTDDEELPLEDDEDEPPPTDPADRDEGLRL